MPGGTPTQMGQGSATTAAASNPAASSWTKTFLLAGIQSLGILAEPGPRRAGRDSIKVNYADAAQVWPYVCGTVKLYPHLVWWGDFASKKVRNGDAIKNISLQAGIAGLAGYVAGGGTFLSSPPSSITGMQQGAISGAISAGVGQLRTASYKYYAGWAYGLCHGPIDGIRTIWVDDKEAASGSTSNAGNTLLIDKPKMWGGDHELGGLYILCDIVRGDLYPTQAPNPYLVSQMSSAGAYSGKAMLILRGPSGYEDSGYFAATPAETPIVRPIAVEVCRFPNNLGVPAYKQCGADSLDANPAEVAYEWATNRIFGGRLPASRVDLASFQAGALQHHTEGLGMSLEYNRQYAVEDALEDVTSLADAVIYQSLTSGTIKYKVIRRTYSIPSLDVLRHGDDASVTTKSQFNVLEVEGFEPGTWKGTPNDLKLEYTNRSNKYQTEKQPAQDLANREIQGRTVTTHREFPGVSQPSVASLVATRELRSTSFPRPQITLYTNREAYDKEPGDVVKLISYKYGWTKILRILEVGVGAEDDSRVRLVCVEDVFGVGASSFAQSTTEFSNPLGASAITSYVVQDAPYFLSRSDIPRVLVFAAKPDNSQVKYDVLVSTDLGNTYAEEGSDFDYAIKGTIAEPVARLTDATLASLTFTPANSFDATRLESATEEEIGADAKNLLYWADTGEWMAVETVTNNGDGTYQLEGVWRAVGGFDSVPAAHSAGATVWFFSPYGRGSTDEHEAGEILRLKLISNAVGGDYAEASASAISHTTSERAAKPLPVRGVTISGDYTLSEIGQADDLLIAWRETNREEEAEVVKQTDPSATPEDGTTYTVRIYRDGSGTAAKTATGLTTPAYTYAAATETSEQGGLASSYEVQVEAVRDGRTSTTYVRSVSRSGGVAGTGSNDWQVPMVAILMDGTVENASEAGWTAPLFTFTGDGAVTGSIILEESGDPILDETGVGIAEE